MAETVICVGAVVRRDATILLVRQAPGHSQAGNWTIPWGRLEKGESPTAAAIRETSEEGGVVTTVEGLIGVQELPAPWSGWIALVYECRHVEGEPTPDGVETDGARYFTAEEFAALNQPVERWSQWLVHRAFAEKTSVHKSDPGNPFGIGYV